VGPTWEFRAVSFGPDEKESTKKLNELAAAGWEYVGPLANSMVAFKRRVLPVAPPPVAKEENKKGEYKEYKNVLVVSTTLSPPFMHLGNPRKPQEYDTGPANALVQVKVDGKTIDLKAVRGTTKHRDRSGEVLDSLSAGHANVRADITTMKTETEEVIIFIDFKYELK
jgi:hypothetical protein